MKISVTNFTDVLLILFINFCSISNKVEFSVKYFRTLNKLQEFQSYFIPIEKSKLQEQRKAGLKQLC